MSGLSYFRVVPISQDEKMKDVILVGESWG